MIPLLDDPDEVDYYWYVGDPLPTVSLYKRTGRYEMPIYENTRGQAVFHGADVDDGTSDEHEPTDAFWSALETFIDGRAERIDVEECEWYEREFLQSLVNVGAETDPERVPTEIGQLFAQVDDDYGGGD